MGVLNRLQGLPFKGLGDEATRSFPKLKRRNGSAFSCAPRYFRKLLRTESNCRNTATDLPAEALYINLSEL